MAIDNSHSVIPKETKAMKKYIVSVIILILFFAMGCGAESPLHIDPPYDPPELRSDYCPGMDAWYLVMDCGACHR